MMKTVRLGRLAIIAAVCMALAGPLAIHQLKRTAPAPSLAFSIWQTKAGPAPHRGAALFALGDFGAIDLDTLETLAMPWHVLAAALAISERGGHADNVIPDDVRTAFRRFGFLYPRKIRDQPDLTPPDLLPLGLTLGRITRHWPPLQVTAINIGCSACHAGPDYRSDGHPDADTAVLGRPNSALDLEAFTGAAYVALRNALARPDALATAMRRLFPDQSLRERLTLDWIVLPRARARMAELAAGIDKPLPFRNGAPGLTNGVGALKHRLGVNPAHRFDASPGFVSVPELADRAFRSALLADGAYAPKGGNRFRAIARNEADNRDLGPMAGIASFFMVPSMGLTSERAIAAIPQLTQALEYLRRTPPPRFPGPIDRLKAEAGRKLFSEHCAACHGSYDDSLGRPQLLSFPNWAGDVGTDPSRTRSFDPSLAAAVAATRHGRTLIDVASTGRTAAQPLSGLWSSAPYFVNGSVPTLAHVLEPATRPRRFMVGGHRLSFEHVGIDGGLDASGTWRYPPGYRPYSAPVVIDTSEHGFSNRGHETQVEGLDAASRSALIEYLKLL